MVVFSLISLVGSKSGPTFHVKKMSSQKCIFFTISQIICLKEKNIKLVSAVGYALYDYNNNYCLKNVLHQSICSLEMLFNILRYIRSYLFFMKSGNTRRLVKKPSRTANWFTLKVNRKCEEGDLETT